MTNTWHELTALELGTRIANGEIDALNLAEHFLDRIEQKDTDHNIYIRATPERARAEAAEALRRSAEEEEEEARARGVSGGEFSFLGQVKRRPADGRPERPCRNSRRTHHRWISFVCTAGASNK